MQTKSEKSPPYLVDHQLPAYDDNAIIAQAIAILDSRIHSTDPMTDPAAVKQYLRLKLSGLEHEVFGMLLLNTKHHVIDYVELFRGTLNSAAVYPREVIKTVLAHNAGAVIFAHNHPSGNATPSQADKSMTSQLQSALALIDVSVLDHILIGDGEPVSFAELGLL